MPVETNGMSVMVTGRGQGAVATYRCFQGLFSTGLQHTRTLCSRNGKWEPPTGTCSGKCLNSYIPFVCADLPCASWVNSRELASVFNCRTWVIPWKQGRF